MNFSPVSYQSRIMQNDARTQNHKVNFKAGKEEALEVISSKIRGEVSPEQFFKSQQELQEFVGRMQRGGTARFNSQELDKFKARISNAGAYSRGMK